MTDEVVQHISDRYIELYERITGHPFQRESSGDLLQRVENNVVDLLVRTPRNVLFLT